MSELFDEVDEDVRRDQLKKLWDQYSIYIIAGALLIIAAVGGWRGYEYLEAKKAAEAGSAFDNATELAEQNKHAEAEAAFNNSPRPRHRDIACWRGCAPQRKSQATIRRRRPSCTTTSRPIAASGRRCRNWQRSAPRDCCWIPRAIPTCCSAWRPDRTGATFRHTARELLALSAWRANDTAAARKWLDLIANDGETPSSLRSRAEALQALLPPVAKS